MPLTSPTCSVFFVMNPRRLPCMLQCADKRSATGFCFCFLFVWFFFGGGDLGPFTDSLTHLSCSVYASSREGGFDVRRVINNAVNQGYFPVATL